MMQVAAFSFVLVFRPLLNLFLCSLQRDTPVIEGQGKYKKLMLSH